MSTLPKPLLSVIVVIVSDTTGVQSDASALEGNLEALANQMSPPPLEIILPYHMRMSGIEEVQKKYPEVMFLPIADLKTFSEHGGGREHHDELRARGLAVARGEILGLLEDHAKPDPRWSEQLVAMHRKEYSGVGGAIENGIDRPLNWAVYFCDFGKYQNPLLEGDAHVISDANASYKRGVLESIRPLWVESFNEPIVNGAIVDGGGKLGISSSIVVYQHREGLRFGDALKERFIWGRSYAATRSKLLDKTKRLMYGLLSAVLPIVLLFRMSLTVSRKGRCIWAYGKAFPFVTLLTMSWCIGEGVGYMTASAENSMNTSDDP